MIHSLCGMGMHARPQIVDMGSARHNIEYSCNPDLRISHGRNETKKKEENRKDLKF